MKNKLFKLLLIIVAVAVSENAVAQAVSFMPEPFTVNSGIVDKLSEKVYGESQLVNQCSDDVDCTEEEHQLNRRSMFIIRQ